MKKYFNFFVFFCCLAMLCVSCEKETESAEPPGDAPSGDFEGDSYFILNGETINFSLTDSYSYTPKSLIADNYNLLTVHIDPDYSFGIEGVNYENDTEYKFYVDELSLDNYLKIYITDNSTKKYITSYLKTLPTGLDQLIYVNKSNPPEYGVYYSAYNNYIFKINSEGDYLYFKYVYQCNNFNRTEVGDNVYYSYLEYIYDSNNTALSGVGYSQKQAVIMDANYQEIDRLTGLVGVDGLVNDGIPLDNHQFEMLDLGHYLVTTYQGETVYNIPDEVPHYEDGLRLAAAVVQEIKDGEAIFSWRSTDYPQFYAYNNYVDFETYTSRYKDYMHVNSATLDTDGNILMSFRGICSVVKLDRAGGTGDVVWILGGEGDQFGLTDAQTFLGQHDIKVTGDCEFTIFNNNYYRDTKGVEDGSGIMKFRLNEDDMSVEYYDHYHKAGVYATAEGSALELDNDHYVLGWGQTDVTTYLFSEESKDGTVHFGYGNESTLSIYKAHKYDE